jgi:NAD(P)-dependent dehydrogenase (short-subunit alcohol dehydrogenase family)
MKPGNMHQQPDLQRSLFPLALVTGSAHRLGKAFALSLARQGYGLALHYNSSVSDALLTADEIRALGVPVFLFHADLTQADQIQVLFETIDETLSRNSSLVSRFSVLVNSAAVMPRADARTLSTDDFDAAIDLNLRAPFLIAQQAYRRMSAGGLIVNISDIAAQKAWTGFPAYTVSKAGLDSLTKVLARSFAPRVRVNAITPGLVLQSENLSPEEWERLVNRLPIPRAATPEEITSTLEFLLKNEYITGQTIVIDGGYSLI